MKLLVRVKVPQEMYYRQHIQMLLFLDTHSTVG